MNSYKQKIRQNFSASAERYNTWATSQEKAAKILTTKITKKDINTILDIGCGTGILIEKLLKKFSSAKITGLDFAPKMIEHCQQKWPAQIFECADAEHFNSDEKYDLITSNFTFQWFSDLAKTMLSYWELLTIDGQMAIALPIDGSLAELATAALKENNKLPALHRLPSEKEITKIINGFPNCRIKICQKEKLTSYYGTPLQAMHSLKKIGAVYKNNNNYSYQEMRNLLKNYPTEQINNKIVYPLSYNVLFIVIEKDN